jgi:hypothetical protein
MLSTSLTTASLLLLSFAGDALASSCVAFDANWNLLAFGFNGKDYNAGEFIRSLWLVFLFFLRVCFYVFIVHLCVWRWAVAVSALLPRIGVKRSMTFFPQVLRTLGPEVSLPVRSIISPLMPFARLKCQGHYRFWSTVRNGTRLFPPLLT